MQVLCNGSPQRETHEDIETKSNTSMTIKSILANEKEFTETDLEDAVIFADRITSGGTATVYLGKI